jgi:DCN1-like protein 1/2
MIVYSSGAGAPLDTVAAQKTFIAQQSSAMSHDVDLFKRVYKHTFICSKEKGQKALPLENAKIYWTMLFSQPGIKWETANRNWLAIWLEFLDAKWTKSVNKDMWNQTFEFFQKSMQDESLSFWSEDGAWPSVIDDFVAYVKEKYPPQGQDGDKMETD